VPPKIYGLKLYRRILMPKIKLKSIACQDINFLDIVYSIMDLRICEDVDELFIENDCIPVIQSHDLYTDTILEKLKIYLQNNINLRCIVLDLKEGTNTTNFHFLGLDRYFNNNQISIISSGNFSNDKSFANIDSYLYCTGDIYNTTVAVNHFDDIFIPRIKPYKFLFLNKNERPHRRRLIDLLNEKKLLDNALWSDLTNDIRLPQTYDDCFNGRVTSYDINNTHFDIGHWPDGRLFPQLYIDTYFSIITETNFEFPYSFCTEKIYKPILMGHPFIAVTSYKFYQHLKDRGYKTFDGLIDESFDLIENNDDRLLAIVNSIEQLCLTNLDDFLIKAKPICEHNRLNFFREYGMVTLNNYNTLAKFFKTLCQN